MRFIVKSIFIFLYSITLMSCSKEISQFEKVPDSWFTIEPTLIGVDDYNPCYELFVIENLDQYSIGRENKCIVPPRILKEEERGDKKNWRWRRKGWPWAPPRGGAEVPSLSAYTLPLTLSCVP